MIYIDDNIQSIDLNIALAEISEQRREKALRFKHEQGKRECVAAYLLLKRALREEYGVCDNPILAERDGGKPYIVGREDIHFNLSHCREAVACAVSSEEVGIDVERIRPFNDSLARYVLNDEEYRKVKSSANPAMEFTKLWTMKESLLKLTGEGIRDDLKQVLVGVNVHFETHVKQEKNYVYTMATYQRFTIGIGKPNEAAQIARLIMTAMTDECCQYFCGSDHTLKDFHSLITQLAGRQNTQYSYANTICCRDVAGNVVGVCTSYDGSELLRLRQAFIDGAKKAFGIDHSSIPLETEAGELYIDSLAVLPEYRGQGIASMLLEKTKEKCVRMGIPAVGLLVDNGNPKAELLYRKCGFEVVGVNEWGGHPMKHMVWKQSCACRHVVGVDIER